MSMVFLLSEGGTRQPDRSPVRERSASDFGWFDKALHTARTITESQALSRLIVLLQKLGEACSIRHLSIVCNKIKSLNILKEATIG